MSNFDLWTLRWGRGKEFEWGKVELEQVPGPAQRPDEKLIVNEHNTQYYPDPNLGQAREIYGRLDKAQKDERFTRIL